MNSENYFLNFVITVNTVANFIFRNFRLRFRRKFQKEFAS